MPTSSREPRHFALMPAGGTGSRLGAALPKQYLDLNGAPMIARSAAALLRAEWVDRVLVVVAPDDDRAADALAGLPRVVIAAEGGPTRRDTVLAGLNALVRDHGAQADDWVLVHDAARPGLDPASLERLRDALLGDPVGGLLALPVSDTVKRAADLSLVSPPVAGTLPREGLWLAQTPQMFRCAMLIDALTRFPDVTDESAAIERAGHAPRLVPGSRDNFKVTTADDLESMRRLTRQG